MLVIILYHMNVFLLKYFSKDIYIPVFYKVFSMQWKKKRPMNDFDCEYNVENKYSQHCIYITIVYNILYISQ